MTQQTATHQITAARTWYLVRHGETEWNAERRMQGQWDSRLTPAGRLHAGQSAALLAQCGVEAVFASPLGRVQETAAIIRTRLDIAPINDDRLKEWSSGDWSGHLYADLASRWPEQFEAWRADMLGVRAPGGENFHDLIARAGDFVASLDAHPARRIAVLAHGFFNRALACVLLGRPPADTLHIRQDNNVVMRITCSDAQRDVCWFRGEEGPFDGLPQESADTAPRRQTA